MSGHTKGPWRLFENARGVGVVSDPWDVAHCGGFSTGRGRSEEIANARLMAAAPDMLEALEGAAAALFRLDGHDKEMFASEIEAVRSAIEKATGQ